MTVCDKMLRETASYLMLHVLKNLAHHNDISFNSHFEVNLS